MRTMLPLAGLIAAITVGSVHADDLALEPINVGTPARIEVFPAAIKLAGPRRQMQLGRHRPLCRRHAAGPDPRRPVRHEQCGRGHRRERGGPAQAGWHGGDRRHRRRPGSEGRRSKFPAFAAPQPVSFEFDTLAALSKQGCNSGACHGSPSGKGGFRLSLRAFDPVARQADADSRRPRPPHQPAQSRRKPAAHQAADESAARRRA